MHPTYYRGCWHVVCRCFLSRRCRRDAEVYNPKAVILHAASLRQAFAHCAIFLVAATRRCRARVSVPLWLTDLSVQLPVIALVGHYPTNKLIGHRLLYRRAVTPFTHALHTGYQNFRIIVNNQIDYSLNSCFPIILCAKHEVMRY